MIDGIINNGPKQPTVAELEAQVKAGQTISLMDLAAAVKAEPKERPRSRSTKGKEEKPSIMERLKQPLPKQTKKSAPQRSAEKPTNKKSSPKLDLTENYLKGREGR